MQGVEERLECGLPPLPHVVEVQAFIALVTHLSDPQRRDALDDHVDRHVVLHFDVAEALLDAREAGLILGDSLRELRTRQRQHPRELRGTEIVVEQRSELLERQTEILQRLDPMQPRELPGPVIPVAGHRIRFYWHQRADLLIVPQGPNGHPAEPGKRSDGQHDATIFQPFRGVRVKSLNRLRTPAARGTADQAGPITEMRCMRRRSS